MRCEGYEEPCWGYHFDVQTRVFFYPRETPNTIATAFAGLALIDAGQALGNERLLALATGVGDFFLRHIPQTEGREGAFFGYLPGDRTPIHNANTLVCALLARLAAGTGREDMRTAAEAGLRWTVALQRGDGSWPYGEEQDLDWVDNFHTGYVLDSLICCAEAGVEVDGGSALERGLAYYRDRLFLQDGTPKYLPQSVYPIDAQCVAQGIRTMTLAASHDASYGALAWRVFDFALRQMQRGDGSFIFQRRRHWTNPTPHMRWVVAPMFESLSCLCAATGVQP